MVVSLIVALAAAISVTVLMDLALGLGLTDQVVRVLVDVVLPALLP